MLRQQPFDVLYLGDEMMKKVLGTDFMEIYENEKISEWNEYMEQVSNWEIEKYLYRV